ncbi:MAG: glycosyltransferase family 8 protein [Clostridiales bacterium]|nr:glycosyltransferase family 8 protein [Clostridiales bacterium]
MENKKTMNLLVSLNSNFVNPVRVMLTSLILNNTHCEITVYALHSELDGEDIKLLTDTAQRYGAAFIPYLVTGEHKEISKKSEFYPPEAFYRLFCTDYLPEEVSRVLYLDGDVIINGSLENLYNLSMTEGEKRYIFAAATDPFNFSKDIFFHKLHLGLPLDVEYINSGVMLMDLDYMREISASAEAAQQLIASTQLFRFADQDLINVLFHEKIMHIDSYMYNYSPVVNENRLFEFKYGSPVIIHFAGSVKPWEQSFPRHSIFGKVKELYEFYSVL